MMALHCSGVGIWKLTLGLHELCSLPCDGRSGDQPVRQRTAMTANGRVPAQGLFFSR